MSLERLVYISESRIEAADIDTVIARLVRVSSARNARLTLTDALLFTGSHFAQILEGPPESIELILTAISIDTRHANIIVTARHPITERIFSGWQMAYHGPSQYVARHVTELLGIHSQSSQRRLTDRLTQMLMEFAAKPDDL